MTLMKRQKSLACQNELNKVCDEITYPFLNFNGGAVEVLE